MSMPLLLLSYPRSGNSFVRYLIECLTGMSTGSDEAYDTIIRDGPLIAEKTHAFLPRMHEPGRGMIFLLRNYKECIPRHSCQQYIAWKAFESDLGNAPGNYLHSLASYDEWPERKLLVYYEDLISGPSELYRIQEFIGASRESADEIAAKYDEHFSASLGSYKQGSVSGGRSQTYHSLGMDPAFKYRADDTVRKNAPALLGYLKRYLEPSCRSKESLYLRPQKEKKASQFQFGISLMSPSPQLAAKQIANVRAFVPDSFIAACAVGWDPTALGERDNVVVTKSSKADLWGHLGNYVAISGRCSIESFVIHPAEAMFISPGLSHYAKTWKYSMVKAGHHDPDGARPGLRLKLLDMGFDKAAGGPLDGTMYPASFMDDVEWLAEKYSLAKTTSPGDAKVLLQALFANLRPDLLSKPTKPYCRTFKRGRLARADIDRARNDDGFVAVKAKWSDKGMEYASFVTSLYCNHEEAKDA